MSRDVYYIHRAQVTRSAYSERARVIRAVVPIEQTGISTARIAAQSFARRHHQRISSFGVSIENGPFAVLKSPPLSSWSHRGIIFASKWAALNREGIHINIAPHCVAPYIVYIKSHCLSRTLIACPPSAPQPGYIYVRYVFSTRVSECVNWIPQESLTIARLAICLRQTNCAIHCRKLNIYRWAVVIRARVWCWFWWDEIQYFVSLGMYKCAFHKPKTNIRLKVITKLLIYIYNFYWPAFLKNITIKTRSARAKVHIAFRLLWHTCANTADKCWRVLPLTRGVDRRAITDV